MSKQTAVPIDHLVINVLKEMDAAHDIFKQLGFTMTPLGRHTMGSINHLMIFEKDYIELIGLPSDGTVLRDELLGNPIGIDGIVFQSSDAEQTHKTLTKRKQSLMPVQSFSRPVNLDGKKVDARFKTVRFTPGQFPAGRIYFCQHFTPELVWRKEWQTHANAAQAVAGFLVVSHDPRKDAEQYCNASGGEIILGQHGEYRLIGEHYALVFIDQEVYEQCYGPLVCESHGRPSFFGAIALKTKSLDAVRQVLSSAEPGLSGIRWREEDNRIALQVPGFNTLLEFVETELI
ncbi:MAG: VOC family protein [Sheuella sp.]|nr:VOC family protein [Sheuella sp.]